MKFSGKIWQFLASDKTVTFIKLTVALVGVIHAVEEFSKAPSAAKKIGFKKDTE